MAIKKVREKTKKVEDPCGEKIRCKSLVIEGTKYRTLLTSKFENRKNWEAIDPNKVLAYLPGTILNVFVKVGQKVRKGEPVVILEAMKMRNKVNMPFAGVVRSVNVNVGDTIPKGFVIIEIA